MDAPARRSFHNKKNQAATAGNVWVPLFSNGPVSLNFSGSKLAAAVNFPATVGNTANIPDTLDLYDLTSPALPVLLNRYNLPNQPPS